MHNQCIVYLLQYCPHLVIVLHMTRSWVQDNQVFSKHANVYFHCQQQCVQKKQPYFQANAHCFIP